MYVTVFHKVQGRFKLGQEIDAKGAKIRALERNCRFPATPNSMQPLSDPSATLPDQHKHLACQVHSRSAFPQSLPAECLIDFAASRVPFADCPVPKVVL